MDQPVIIITGASQGMGAAAAAIAAEKGSRVVLVARDRAALEREEQQISRRGGTAMVVAGDISTYSVCQEVVRQTVQTFGRIDALINNAAVVSPICTVADLSPDEWKHTLEVNLLGPVLLCKEAIPYLRETRGRIVNVSSGAAFVAIPAGSAYGCSKAALNYFSKVLSAEEPSITVVFINPGDMDTAMMADIREKGLGVKAFEELHRILVDTYEQGQLLRPEVSALATVNLALAAPVEWSGKFIDFDEDEGQAMIRECAARWMGGKPE